MLKTNTSRMAITKTKIILLVILCILIIFYFLLQQGQNEPRVQPERMDQRIAETLATGINYYLSETKDINFTFGMNKNEPNLLTFEYLIKKLQQKIVIGNATYGPYLNPVIEEKLIPKDKHKNGWKIIVDRKVLKAEVISSTTGNEIVFK